MKNIREYLEEAVGYIVLPYNLKSILKYAIKSTKKNIGDKEVTDKARKIIKEYYNLIAKEYEKEPKHKYAKQLIRKDHLDELFGILSRYITARKNNHKGFSEGAKRDYVDAWNRAKEQLQT